MKIGVYGSSEGLIKNKVREKAREIGRQIARNNHILVTGGCNGLPHDAVIGAYEFKGKCVAFSPARNIDEHVERDKFPFGGFEKIIFVSENYEHADNPFICRKYRNISSVAYVDAGIIIGGRTGTMNEFTLLYDLGKNIGILENSGGITTNTLYYLLKDIDKDRGSKIIYDPDPVMLVNRISKI